MGVILQVQQRSRENLITVRARSLRPLEKTRAFGMTQLMGTLGKLRQVETKLGLARHIQVEGALRVQ